jgi:hypothetical protein
MRSTIMARGLVVLRRMEMLNMHVALIVAE